MLPTTKKLVTNEAMQPIAVQIDYADWLKIEALLEQYTQKPRVSSPNPTVWQNQWCELAQKIDNAWKNEVNN